MTKLTVDFSEISDEVFNEEEFPNIIESENDELQSEIKKIADLFEKLLDHYRDISNDSLATYAKHVLNEDFFKSLVAAIKETASKGATDKSLNEFYEKIDNMSKEMFNAKMD